MWQNNISEKVSTRVLARPGGSSDMASILSGGASDDNKSNRPTRATNTNTNTNTNTSAAASSTSSSNAGPSAGGKGRAEYAPPTAAQKAARSTSPWATDADLAPAPAPRRQPAAAAAAAPAASSSAPKAATQGGGAKGPDPAAVQIHGTGRSSTRLHAPPGGKSQISFG
jgi:hypothetical protein